LYNKPNIAVLIPAAGASNRMGTPKQLLNWKNTTLLGNAIDVAEKLQSPVIVVLGANLKKIKASINQYQIQVLKNRNWENGLGNSIAFGVNHIIENLPKVNAILIMLADQPLINTEYLKSLIDKYKIDEGQIIASSYKNRKHGVPVLFDKVYFEELSKLNDDKGAKILLQKYAKKVSVINSESMVSDIDTLEDYKHLYIDNH